MENHRVPESENPNPKRGGIVSPESAELCTQAETAFREQKYGEAQKLIKKALEEDDANLDAHSLSLAFLTNEKTQTLPILEHAEKIGRERLIKILGDDAFKQGGPCVGKFWSILETRPYMRILTSIREVSAQREDWSRAAEVAIEMLRLCPEDNMGVRSYLPVYLLGLSRYLDCLNFTFNWLSSDNPPQGGTILASRSTNDFDVHLTAKSSKTKTAINRSIDGEGVHSAAFAAFMVFGDVELSRELLRKSVSLNPHILCRILAGTPRPDDFNRTPRTLNGVQAAVDYLYVSQPLWEENKKVLAWVRSDQSTMDILLKPCDGPACGKKETQPCQFQGCSACKTVNYCSTTCQMAHWKLPGDEGHKNACKAHRDFYKKMDQAGSGGLTMDGGQVWA